MRNLLLKLFAFTLMTSISTVNAQTILSGIEGASNFRIAQDIKDYTGIKTLDIKSSSGSVENFNNVKAGTIAFVQYDVLQQEAWNDLTNITNRTDDIKVLLSLGNEEIHLVAHTESNIGSIRDLNDPNIKVGIGSKDQGTAVTALIIKQQTECKWTDVNLSFKESIKALLTREIDAFFFVGSAPVAAFKPFSLLSPANQKKIKLISISDTRLKEIYGEPVRILRTTYDWAPYDVTTYAVISLLVTKTTGETAEQQKQIKELLSAIKTNVINLQKDGHPQWRQVAFNFNKIDWPVHSVADEVFKKKKPGEN